MIRQLARHKGFRVQVFDEVAKFVHITYGPFKSLHTYAHQYVVSHLHAGHGRVCIHTVKVHCLVESASAVPEPVFAELDAGLAVLGLEPPEKGIETPLELLLLLALEETELLGSQDACNPLDP